MPARLSPRVSPRTTRVIPHPATRLAAAGLALGGLAAVAIAPTVSAEPPVAAEAPVVAVAAPAAAQAPAVVPSAPVPTASVAAADRAAAAARADRAVSARQALAARQARFTHFTLNSKDTKDMRGIEPSLYRGKFFNATAEEKRLCIVKRESEGEYDVVNPGGNYFGAYQVSRALARGATFMMLPEHKKLMGTAKAKEVLSKLRSKPMNAWPRYWQDAAFHTVINWEGTLSGAAHWAGGRWHC